MSEVLEKTIAAIPKLIKGNLLSKTPPGTGTFQQFVKTLWKITSDYEEQKFIRSAMAQQKARLESLDCPLSEKREILVSLLYCQMLGYDVSFAYIHAVKLAHQGSIREKRTGYLACSMFLHDKDELVILLTGTLMSDLKSSNVLHICYALNAASNLVSAELMPMILPAVQDRLQHQKEIVRRKAVMCLHSFLVKAPSMVQQLQPQFKKALCDNQPSVMWAALHIYTELAKDDPMTYRDLVPALIGILQQIINRQLPSEYEHHSIPAPWLTALVLQLIGILAKDDEATSKLVYPVMIDVLQRTEISHKAGLAVIYECVETIAVLHPDPVLLEQAAACVARFLTAKSINYKYLGVKALTSIVKVNPQYAAQHQDLVMECLEHEDNDIRSKTLELLYHMANSVNVSVISGRLLDSLSPSTSASSQADIVKKVLTLTQKFATCHDTYLDTMNRVLCIAGEVCMDEWTEIIIQTIQTGTPSLPINEDSHLLALRVYWKLLQKADLPSNILHVAVWVLGQYSHLTTIPDLSQVNACLTRWYYQTETPCKLRILSAFGKLLPNMSNAEALLSTLEKAPNNTGNPQIKQQFHELHALSRITSQQKEFLSSFHHSNDEKMDFTLSFLDDFVSNSLENGGKPYQSRISNASSNDMAASVLFGGMHSSRLQSPGVLSSAEDSGAVSSVSSSSQTVPEFNSTGLQLEGVEKVWGPGGKSKKNTASSQSKEVTECKESIAVLNENTEEDKEQMRKSQLAASLFGGIQSSQKNNTGSFNVKVNNEINNPAVQNQANGLSDNMNMFSQSAQYPQRAEHHDPVTQFSNSLPYSNLVTVESNHVGKSQMCDSNKAAVELDHANAETTQAVGSDKQDTIFSPEDSLKLSKQDVLSNSTVDKSELELELEKSAKQGLLDGSVLTSPEELQSMYTGFSVNLAPDDFINVETTHLSEKVDRIKLSDSSHQSSPCKSVGSMDADSIEDG